MCIAVESQFLRLISNKNFCDIDGKEQHDQKNKKVERDRMNELYSNGNDMLAIAL